MTELSRGMAGVAHWQVWHTGKTDNSGRISVICQRQEKQYRAALEEWQEWWEWHNWLELKKWQQRQHLHKWQPRALQE